MPTALPRALVALAIFLLFFSIGRLPGAGPQQVKANQTMVLSVTQSEPDTQIPPGHSQQTGSNQTTSAVVTPWQGPIAPVQITPSPLAPVFSRLPITEPVVFLGIDDGWYQSPENLHWLKAHRLPFSLFVVDSQIKNNYGYFKELQNAGMVIEDHSVSHPDLAKLSLADQQAQICNAASDYQTIFGHRPTFFRPPYGDSNALTQQAAASCAIKALINWRVVLRDGTINFQSPSTHLEPGDIILAHFQSDFIANMRVLNAQLEQDHLQVARLEDWLR